MQKNLIIKTMIKQLLLALLELNSENITAKTGQRTKVSGLFRSGKEFIALTKGEKFPPSISNVWTLVVSV
jgi:hypothetical protein